MTTQTKDWLSGHLYLFDDAEEGFEPFVSLTPNHSYDLWEQSDFPSSAFGKLAEIAKLFEAMDSEDDPGAFLEEYLERYREIRSELPEELFT
jgi:hypothetical protein